jgi:hypothetical protein
MILNEFLPKHVTSIDIDPNCQNIALAFNKYNHRLDRFTALHADMFDVDYTNADTIINTSYEHVLPEDWHALVKKYPNALYIIQSNNYPEPDDHINCVEYVDDLTDQLNFDTLFYKGTLETPIYKRFMVIGTYG